MRVGVDRVREASAQRLRKEFNAIEFNADETLDKFNMRIMGIVNSLRTLGDTLPEVDIVRKILEVVPERYSQIACSIETLLDLNVVSVKELMGRLRCSETRRTSTTSHGGGALLLTEAEWETRWRQREQGQGSSSGGAKDKKGKGKQQNRGRDGGRRDSGGERDMSKVKCYNCNKYNNHFSRDCPEPRRERKERANLVQGQEEEPALLIASVDTLALTNRSTKPVEHVLLNEERSRAKSQGHGGECDTAWFLDSGASNHMCGRRDFFSELDTSVHGFVKLGDDSSVEIIQKLVLRGGCLCQ
jgi:hypothetical protein